MLKRRLPRVLLGTVILVTVLLHVTRLVPLQIIDAVENFAYDTRVRLTAPRDVDDRIVIVDIDEASLREEGRWPWSRTKLKELVDALFEDYKVALVGFDVVFAERDENRALQDLENALSKQNEQGLLARLQHLGPSLDRDEIFADALSKRATVLGYYFDTNPARTGSRGLLPEPVFETDLLEFNFHPPKASSYGGNLATLQTSAAGAGFFSNPLLDSDGIVRRIPTLHEYRGALYESLSVSVVRTYLDEIVVPIFADTAPESGYPALEGLSIGELAVPIDANGAVLVPYRGTKGSFPYVSAAAVLQRDPALEKRLQGKIALVGTTALGIMDLRTTPMHAAFPGVEIHANVISGILDQTIRHRPAWTWGAEVACVSTVGLILIIVSPFLGPLSLSVLALALTGAVVTLNLYLWQWEYLVVPLAATLLTIWGAYFLAMIHGFFSESRAQRRIRDAFSHYMAPTLVERLVDDPSQLRLSGETREMTFVFSDLVRFTALTERSDPETLVSLLNEYLDGMCQVVMDNGGTIDKIVGDAIYAIFNAPLDQPDHACRAVQCALGMDRFSVEFVATKSRDGIAMGGTRIGVNTGTAVIGNFGGSQRFDYTAYGDPINTASRVENANRYLGTRICIAATTVEQCPHLPFRPIAALTVKGKKIPVEVFEPITPEAAESDRVKEYLAAFELLKTDSEEAKTAFRILAEKYPDDAAIALHNKRLARGETGIRIVLTRK